MLRQISLQTSLKTLLETDGWINAKSKGLIKTVGRDYIIQEGDVVEIKIFDLSGREVYNLLGNGVTQIEFEGLLASGLYSLEIKQGAKVKYIKLVVN